MSNIVHLSSLRASSLRPAARGLGQGCKKGELAMMMEEFSFPPSKRRETENFFGRVRFDNRLS